jgi:hypothetical protein
LVSKKISVALTGVATIEFEAGGQAAPILTQAGEGFFPTAVAGNLKPAIATDGDFDLVAGLKFQGFNDSAWQAHGQAISPFCYLQNTPPMIYN